MWTLNVLVILQLQYGVSSLSTEGPLRGNGSLTQETTNFPHLVEPPTLYSIKLVPPTLSTWYCTFLFVYGPTHCSSPSKWEEL